MTRRLPRVIVLGLGPIGRAVAREVVQAPDLKLVAAVDPAVDLAGKDLGRLLRADGARGLTVAASLEEIGRRGADVAVHMAASRFPQAALQIKELVARRLPVVSTCEELIAAPYRFPREAGALDRACRRAGIAVLATGVNPGFVMDLLPAVAANVSVGVRSLRVERHVDTSKRRKALQEKTGAGISRGEFRRRRRENRIGHVGLRDSAIFLMNHVPLEGEVTEEVIRPIVAQSAVDDGRNRIEKGRVLGVHHQVRALHPETGRTVARFELKMAYGLKDPRDEIRIEGDPPVHLLLEGGISGDRATVGAVLSSIRSIGDAPAGLGARIGARHCTRKR